MSFQQGGNSGSGHGLQVELFRVGLPDKFETVAVSGVRSIQIRRNVVLDVQSNGRADGLFGAAPRHDSLSSRVPGATSQGATSQGANSPAAGELAALPTIQVADGQNSRESTPLHVTSAGPLTFDLRANVATFIEKVVVARPLPGAEADLLQCDKLKLLLEPGSEEAKAKSLVMREKAMTGLLSPRRRLSNHR